MYIFRREREKVSLQLCNGQRRASPFIHSFLAFLCNSFLFPFLFYFQPRYYHRRSLSTRITRYKNLLFIQKIYVTSLSSSNSIRTCIRKIPIFLTSKKRNRKKSLTNQRSSPILQKSFSAINFPNFFAFAKGYCPPGYFFSPFLLILHIRSWKSAVHPSLAFPFLKNKKKRRKRRKKERKEKKITETIGERARGNVFIVPSSSCLLLPPFSRSSRRKRLLLVPLLRRVPSPPPPPPASGLPAHNARAGFFWPRVQKPRRACGFHRNGRVNCQLRGGERRRGRERERRGGEEDADGAALQLHPSAARLVTASRFCAISSRQRERDAKNASARDLPVRYAMKGIRTARGHLIPTPRSTGYFRPDARTRSLLLLQFERSF